jgi:hypothetical protein
MRETLLPDLGMPEGLPSANTFEPLVEARYFSLLEEVNGMEGEVALRTLGVMNVAYLLDPDPRPDLEPIYSGPVNVYRNPRLLPRARVVCQSIVVDSPQDALRMLSLPDFDPVTTVVLEEGTAAGSDCSKSWTATLLPSDPNQVTIRAVLPQAGYLVLADTHYPGWMASVDGSPVDILRANYAFRAVSLDAGAHEVTFDYRPRTFLIGVGCSGVAIAAAIAVLVGLRRCAGRRRT